MSKPIKLNLPPELEARGRELAGNRRLATVIVEALKAQWFQPEIKAVKTAMNDLCDADKEHDEDKFRDAEARLMDAIEEWPVVGSIPAEQKRDA